MSSGKIVQIIGAVVDVEFSREQMPKVYDALTVQDRDLVLEVQQQLGDGVVRTIAMGSSDGFEPRLGRHQYQSTDQRAGRERNPGPHHERPWASLLMKKALSASSPDGRFTGKPPATRNKHRPPNCWKPASR